jgi:hypothetical protein
MYVFPVFPVGNSKSFTQAKHVKPRPLLFSQHSNSSTGPSWLSEPCPTWESCISMYKYKAFPKKQCKSCFLYYWCRLLGWFQWQVVPPLHGSQYHPLVMIWQSVQPGAVPTVQVHRYHPHCS